MKISRSLIVSILLILILPAAAFHVSGMKQEGLTGAAWLVIDALNLPFGQSVGIDGGQQQDSSVLFIENSEGRLLTAATWDGSAPRISAGGKEWVFSLSALLEGRRIEYELGINIENKAKLPGGSVVLSVKDLSGYKMGSSYRHTLRLHGFKCLVSDDGRLAALSPYEAQSNGLSSFIALVMQSGKCRIFPEQADAAENEPSYVNATSEIVEGFDSSVLIEVLLVPAQSWAPEHVLSFAGAIDGTEMVPDIRVKGVSDKAAASPGETVKYSYFIFNAGTGNAVDVELSILIPAQIQPILESLRASKGELRILQQVHGKQASYKDEEGTKSNYEEKIMRILLTEEITAGEAISIEIEVEV